jgi:hypothetical protein
MTVNINVPEELYEQAQIISRTQNVSVDEVLASAFTEHIAAWQRLRERAARGDRQKFLTVLDQVSDVEPEEYDRI